MARYQIWDKQSDIFTPSGDRFTAAEWAARYSRVKIPGAKMIITTGLINGGTAMEFEAAKAAYIRQGAPITDDMADGEVLAAIERFEDSPPHSDEPTVEERTAAALEFLAVNRLPDEN